MKTHRFLKYHPQDWSCDSKSKWHCCDTVKLFQTSPHWQRVHLVFKAYHHIQISYLNIFTLSTFPPARKPKFLLDNKLYNFINFQISKGWSKNPGFPPSGKPSQRHRHVCWSGCSDFPCPTYMSLGRFTEKGELCGQKEKRDFLVAFTWINGKKSSRLMI